MVKTNNTIKNTFFAEVKQLTFFSREAPLFLLNEDKNSKLNFQSGINCLSISPFSFVYKTSINFDNSSLYITLPSKFQALIYFAYVHFWDSFTFMSSIKLWQLSKLYIMVCLSCSFQFSAVHLNLWQRPNKYKFRQSRRKG